jgi:septal ring factor EnvC (AmiA/AmiB activator)
MRQEVAEFHVTEATFLAKIERVRAELKALEDQLTEIRNSAVQEVEIEEVKSSLNRLEEVEKEYQGLVAPSP